MDSDRIEELLEKPLNKKTIDEMREEFAYAYANFGKKKKKRILLTIGRYLRQEHPELDVSIEYENDAKHVIRYKHTHIYSTRGGNATYSGFILIVDSPEGYPHLHIKHDTTKTYASLNINHQVYYEIGRYEHEKEEMRK